MQCGDIRTYHRTVGEEGCELPLAAVFQNPDVPVGKLFGLFGRHVDIATGVVRRVHDEGIDRPQRQELPPLRVCQQCCWYETPTSVFCSLGGLPVSISGRHHLVL